MTTPAETRGVGGHVQEGAADVEVVLAARHEQPGRDAVHQDADGGHDHDGRAGDRARARRSGGRPPRRWRRRRRAGGRRWPARPGSTTRAGRRCGAAVGGALGQRPSRPRRSPGPARPRGCARRRPSGRASSRGRRGRLDGDEAEVQRDADGERLAEARRGVACARGREHGPHGRVRRGRGVPSSRLPVWSGEPAG